MDWKKASSLKFLWAFGVMALGLLLNRFNIGTGSFAGYGSVGTYLLYIGILGLAIIGLKEILKKKQIKDERTEFVAAKAMRITFLAFVIISFALMVADGIRPIAMPYHLFLSYFVSGMVAVLFISYRILLKAN